MKTSKLIAILVLAFCSATWSSPAHAHELSGTAFITNCRSDRPAPGYKRPTFGVRAYTHFECGSSVYVWNATVKTALVQQGKVVAYIASKYVSNANTNEDEERPADARTFLQAMAEAVELPDSSAISVRQQLVRACLATRGCEVEIWANLAWKAIRNLNQLIPWPGATLRFFARGTYYSAFIVNPPIRFKGRPLPSIESPVLVVEGGGLSLAIVNHASYALGDDGRWAAAGASAVQAVAAIR